MSKNKTALIQAIEDLQERREITNDKFIATNAVDRHTKNAIIKTFDEQIEVLKSYIPVEREQIERAFTEGSIDANRGEFIHLDKYYTNTYEQ